MDTQNVPSSPIKSTPKDFFMHLLEIVTLYIGVVSLLSLFFQYTNVWFPDALNYYYADILDTIRMASSALLVGGAVFLLLSWMLEKDMTANPQKREMRVRKWLLYFTLFVAAITIIIDLIVLIYNFYGGELTARFVLKVIAVLIVAAAVFGYYLWDLRRVAGPSKIPRISAWSTAAVIVIIVITGFFVVGTPAQQRAVRFDEQRVNDMNEIQNMIIQYYQNKETVPATLTDLQDDISGFKPKNDPQTNQPYEYQRLSTLSFELCATFQTSGQNSPSSQVKAVPAPYLGNGISENWQHSAGRVCFTRTIDPQIYRPKPLN